MAGSLGSPHRPGRGDHACTRYTSTDEQRSLLNRALLTGLERGEQVVYLADTTSAATVLDWLRSAGVEARPYLQHGQLAVYRAGDFCLGAFAPAGAGSRRGTAGPGARADRRGIDPDLLERRLRELYRAARDGGYTGLRITSEMSWLSRTGLTHQDLLAVEQRLGRLVESASDGGVVAICQYDVRRFPPGELDALERLHGLALRSCGRPGTAQLVTGTYTDPPALHLRGEIDLTNCHEFAAALADAVRPGQDLLVDMSGLGFVEVAAIRMLVRTAGRFPAGRRLVLLSPPLIVSRVLEASGSPLPPALVLTERSRHPEGSGPPYLDGTEPPYGDDGKEPDCERSA